MKAIRLLCLCLVVVLLLATIVGCQNGAADAKGSDRATTENAAQNTADSGNTQGDTAKETYATYTAFDVTNGDSVDGNFINLQSTAGVAVFPYVIEEDTAPRELTVEFEGNSYTGQYQHTQAVAGYVCVARIYKNGNVQFSVDRETGALLNFEKRAINAAPRSVTEDQARQAADRFVAGMIDAAGYTVTTVSVAPAYLITYVRIVSGFETTDRVQVQVAGDGSILGYSALAPRCFDNVSAVTVDTEKINNTIESALNDISREWTRYEISEVRLAREPDGSCALVYGIVWHMTPVSQSDGNGGQEMAANNKHVNMKIIVTPVT